MRMNGLGLGLGLGAVAGAVGIFMLSRSNPARQLAVKAATKVESTARMVTDKLTETMQQ